MAENPLISAFLPLEANTSETFTHPRCRTTGCINCIMHTLYPEKFELGSMIWHYLTNNKSRIYTLQQTNFLLFHLHAPSQSNSSCIAMSTKHWFRAIMCHDTLRCLYRSIVYISETKNIKNGNWTESHYRRMLSISKCSKVTILDITAQRVPEVAEPWEHLEIEDGEIVRIAMQLPWVLSTLISIGNRTSKLLRWSVLNPTEYLSFTQKMTVDWRWNWQSNVEIFLSRMC